MNFSLTAVFRRLVIERDKKRHLSGIIIGLPAECA